MKVKRLHLQNYGRFEDLKIDFAPTAEKTGSVTVIVGNNGAGKSQILQALATSLSWFVSRLVSDTDGFEVDKALIKNGKNDAEINVLVDFGENNPSPYGPIEDAYWTISNVRDGRINSFSRSTKELKKSVRNFRLNLTSKDEFSLPIVSFYPVNRGVDSSFTETSKNFFSDQLIAYENALESSVSFESFFVWFREREDIENQESRMMEESIVKEVEESNRLIKLSLSILNNKEGGQSRLDDRKELESRLERLFSLIETGRSELARGINMTDKPLSCVRSSIERFTSFENIRIRRQGTPTMVVEKDGEELDVNQLSQGEKSLLALVGDIARRLALLNPSLDNPLEGEGVVMIDEVDLHLHPKWQHDLIDKLVDTFPNVQFILTTHSPHVISDRNDILLYSLDDGELTEMPNVYGEDANTVLTKIFDVDIRDSKVEEQFTVIRRAISNQDYPKAENKIAELVEKLPSDHLELLKCRLLLAQAKLASGNNNEPSHAKD